MNKPRMIYSEAFKQKVVREIEDGKWPTRLAAREAYGIGGCGTICNWIRRYGRSGYHRKAVLIMDKEEESELVRLRRQVIDLKNALAQTQMDSLINRAYFQVVCDKFGVEDVEALKKNIDTRRLMPHTT